MSGSFSKSQTNPENFKFRVCIYLWFQLIHYTVRLICWFMTPNFFSFPQVLLFFEVATSIFLLMKAFQTSVNFIFQLALYFHRQLTYILLYYLVITFFTVVFPLTNLLLILLVSYIIFLSLQFVPCFWYTLFLHFLTVPTLCYELFTLT